MNKVKVLFGGWYQRTTLHLSEVHKFLSTGKSDLKLNEVKLRNFRNRLRLKSVKRIAGALEYLDIDTKGGVNIKYFEDGLYILSWEGVDINEGKGHVKDYFYNRFKPATDYLFSLGAPTPKILSNIKETHPFVIERIVKSPKTSKVDEKFGRVYFATESGGIKVSKTPENIFIDVSRSRKKELELLTEMQVFFSDFKLQLHKYLNIHREIWEDIDAIKERKTIRGKNVGKYKAELDSYQKTVQLIRNRINQMGNYARTRQKISERVKIDRHLNELFQYRFEDLFNTLEYIKEVWNMTLDYVNSAIRVLNEVSEEASRTGLDSIKFLVGVGVVSGFVGYLGPAEIPDVALSGILYIVGFGVAAIGIDKVMNWWNERKQYELGFIERSKEI